MLRKTALVTGASKGGIGSALVEECQRQGFRVFATVRSLEKGSHLKHLENVSLVVLDVTQSESIARAVEAVKAETNGQLDVLINNSGGGFVAPLLDSSIEDGQNLFDVNVWGPLRMAQAFAAMLLASKGCLVNIGSVAGVVQRPWMGLYNSSKSAANMISESLRLELEPLGVRVITAMVGEVKTNFFENRPSLPALRKDSLYAAASEGINAMARGDLQLKQEDPTEFAAFMVSSIMRGATGCIYKGGNAVTGKWASALMPTRLLDRIVSRGTGLDKLLSR